MTSETEDIPKVENAALIKSENLFLVVGIGASAGGLDAFKQLIKAIPVDSGIAYILVQHLDPNHQSILTELLQKSTTIPIQEITDNVTVEPNNIYVIPSNKLLTANDGILNLTVRPKTLSMSIDVFFKSLAEVHQSQAIGVVLSGTGKDGTAGLKAIKEYGGITFAQHQETASYDEMPQSAINADVVDFILSPEEIIQYLLKLNYTRNNKKDETPDVQSEDAFFKQILGMIDIRKAVDFTYYKQTTIRRRIARRMLLGNQEKIEDYYNYLRDNPAEIDTLFQDILIPVTNFFRDKKTFEALCDSFLPTILNNKPGMDSLRVWVVGCSTGQEPYSIGICLAEFFEQHKDKIRIQIFATDISEIAITKARTGLYSRSEVENISEVRLQKFFRKADGGFQINKSIREMCVFASHNILANPPFADIDLISCRNVLIYMDTFLQRKAMAAFHYALKEKGMLMLGKSESVGNSSDLFASSNDHDKIYVRKSVPGRFIHVAAKRREDSLQKETPKEKISNDDFYKNADEVILAKSPAGVIVNDEMDIVQFRGSTGEWLESAPGKPSLNVLKMAKRALVLDLRNTINKVKSTGQPVIKEGIAVPMKDYKKLVTIEVIPLLNTINAYFLILFKNTEEVPLLKSDPNKKISKAESNAYALRLEQLEKELAQTREDMRTIGEDNQAGNEELLSSNEELLSNSEELRSLNEELEISKEELQSTVEELSVSNQELASINEQLNHSRKYAEAIVTTIREPLVVLDRDLRVKSANTSFYKTFKRTEQETEGRLFYELENYQWDLPDLRKLLERTLEETLYESYEVKRKFSSIGERIMLLNARKIFSEGKNAHLILLAIEDITEQRLLENELIKSSAYQKAILESSPQITSTSSATGSVTYFNQFFLDYAGVKLAEAITWGWQRVIHPDMLEEFMKAWTNSITSGKNFYKEVLLKRHDGEYRWHISRALAIRNNEGAITSWVGTASDIHDQKMFSEELEKKVSERTQLLKESNINLEHSNKNLEQFAFIASHDLQEPLRKIKTFSNMLADKYIESLAPEGKKLVNKIHSSSERMSVLIHDVLNFSRIEKSRNEFVATNLNEILQNVLVDFSLLIAEKNAQVNQGQLPTLEVIPFQINQLFYNLISNSLKFTIPDRQPILTITSRMLNEAETKKHAILNQSSSYFEIIFSDNGLGFDEQFAEKVFEIFQRLHTKQQFAGTGIGLALCKKIIINHRGEIFVKASENAGVSFQIILPIRQVFVDGVKD